MTVTHNGRQYTVTKMADGAIYRLVSVEKPREQLTLTAFQMRISGLLEQVEANA